MAIIVNNGNSGMLTEYEVTVADLTSGYIPVPNCQAGLDWWLDAAERNPGHTLELLIKLQEMKLSWVEELLETIVKECNI